MSFFDRVASRYDRAFSPSARETADDLAPLLDGRSGVVLDLGCGTGRAFPHLVARGFRVVGLDASLPMLREASRRASCLDVVRVRADLYGTWPIRDASIDVVLALHSVLAHPPADPRVAWARVGDELRRVCKPGALCVLDLPEPAWAREHLERVGPDRYRFGAPELAIDAFVPEPAEVLAALGLPLSLVPGPLGARAITAPSSAT